MDKEPSGTERWSSIDTLETPGWRKRRDHLR